MMGWINSGLFWLSISNWSGTIPKQSMRHWVYPRRNYKWHFVLAWELFIRGGLFQSLFICAKWSTIKTWFEIVCNAGMWGKLTIRVLLIGENYTALWHWSCDFFFDWILNHLEMAYFNLTIKHKCSVMKLCS